MEGSGSENAAKRQDLGQTHPSPAARAAMELGLLRTVLWLMTLAIAALVVRELVFETPALAAVLGVALSGGFLAVSYMRRIEVRSWGPIYFIGLGGVILLAAVNLGGPRGSSLSVAFIPGLLATLTLGARVGWSVTGLMLLGFAALGLSMPLETLFDQLRFSDEIAMTIFCTGLAQTLVRSFAAYESAIEGRRDRLALLEQERKAMATAFYEELEPAAEDLVTSVPSAGVPCSEPRPFEHVVGRLAAGLRRAKDLAQAESLDARPLKDPDPDMRRATMRIWLRLGAVMMLFFAVRNLWLGAPFLPSLVSFGACLVFDFWLGRTISTRLLELTALGIGLVATGPIIAYVALYGGSPSVPALVVTPATILFTALLSRGPAVWLVVVTNICVLSSVTIGHEPTAADIRILGDLVLSFVVIVLALRRVFALRESYAETLSEQAALIAEALRQRRRLAGTLFHDASNHLQAIMLYSLEEHDRASTDGARSLSRRVQRLIELSKRFLMQPNERPAITEFSLDDAFSLVQEAFVPHLKAKQLNMKLAAEAEFEVRIEPELFIESVLGNLVSNAVKFSPRGGKIEVRVEQQGSEVSVAISDSGPGFPEVVLGATAADDVLPTRVGTAGEPGQGYGLQLAREHVERMGGRLELRNRPEGGAESRVWLQLAGP